MFRNHKFLGKFKLGDSSIFPYDTDLSKGINEYFSKLIYDEYDPSNETWKVFIDYWNERFKKENIILMGNKIFIEVPGFSKENLEILIDKDVLSINGEIEEPIKKTIKISKKLDSNIYDLSLISVKLENGLLIIELKKKDNPPIKIQID